MVEAVKRRIYWALLGPNTLASSRLHGYFLHEQLRNRGWDSRLLYLPRHRVMDVPLSAKVFADQSLFSDGDIVVFQKLRGIRTQEALKSLGARGVNTVFIDCDFPPKVNEAQSATVTICSSHVLGNLYRAVGVQPHILREPYESSSERRPLDEVKNEHVTCVWFGSMDSLKSLEVQWLRRLLNLYFPRYKLIVIAEQGQGDLQWDNNTAWNIISRCDIALVTGNESIASSCKSPNRIVQAMALSLPVIAFPVPSYKGIIQHGRNGFLCNGDEEWIQALTMLGSRQIRKKVAVLGYRYVRRYYGAEKIIDEWERVLSDLPRSESHRSILISPDRYTLSLARVRDEAYRFMIANLNKQMGDIRELKRTYRNNRIRECDDPIEEIK